MGHGRAALVGTLAVAAIVTGASMSVALLDDGDDRSRPCEVDGCGWEDEKLGGDAAWLGARLTGAGLDYVDGYRPDGGGGHVVRDWGFQIWVLRPPERTPEQVAARWDHEPLWSEGSVTVFGHARRTSPTAYFYWRAGGVDNFMQLDWAGSRAESIEDLRGVFGKLIAEEQRNPYPGG